MSENVYSEEEVSQIVADKDAEIERLSAKWNDEILLSEKNRKFDAVRIKDKDAEIARLKQLLRDVYDKIILIDPEEATQAQQHESLAIVKRLRQATIKIRVLEEAPSDDIQS